MLTLDKIYHAAFVLRDVARRTDLIEAPHLSRHGGQLYLKTENLQVTGSFKVRGAYYKISQLSPEERAKGVIACSAGNHAQGVALAATRMGIRSIVCMPDGAPIMKVENTKNLGAEVCLVPGTYDDAHDYAVSLQAETGMTFIHPYDDELVIAGQGTIGLEILDQLPDLDAVIVPIGGGGLIAGIAFTIKSLRPDVKVYGVQAAGAPSMYLSVRDHRYQTLDTAATFADGIQVKTPGELTYELCEKYVDEVVTVSEDEIAAAILSLMENQKLVAEGAGAVPVAAALFDKLPIQGKKAVCVLSGGNIDVNILSRVITRGLIMSGRKANLTIALEDKPGQLTRVSSIVAECGGNVVSVQYDGSDPNMPISSCFLKLGMETRDAAQIEQIRTELSKAGFQLVNERTCGGPAALQERSFCHECDLHFQRARRHRALQPGPRPGGPGVRLGPAARGPRHRPDARHGGGPGRPEPGQPPGHPGRGRPDHGPCGQDGDLPGGHQRFCRRQRRVRPGVRPALSRPQLRAGGGHPQGGPAGDRVHRPALSNTGKAKALRRTRMRFPQGFLSVQAALWAGAEAAASLAAAPSVVSAVSSGATIRLWATWVRR